MINKVVYAGKTLIDLTADTVTEKNLQKGYTAHDKSGAIIVGTLEKIDTESLLEYGLEGNKEYLNNCSVIITTDSTGRKLIKTFSDDFLTCTSTLYASNDVELGKMVKKINGDKTTTIQHSDGKTLVKNFSNDSSLCVSILYDEDGTEISRYTTKFK